MLSPTIRRAIPSVSLLNQWIVAAYKFVGFVVLGVILVGLGTYFVSHVYFLVAHDWVIPAVVGPTDPQVVQLHMRVVEHTSRRDALRNQRVELLANMSRFERTIVVEGQFQQRFVRAMDAELAHLRTHLGRYSALQRKSDGGSREIDRVARELGDLSHRSLQEWFGVGLLDRDSFVAREQQLSTLALSKLSLDERNVELAARVDELSSKVRSTSALRGSFQAIDAGDPRLVEFDDPHAELRYDTVRVHRELDLSRLAVAGAELSLRAAGENLRAVDAALTQVQQLLQGLASSAYLEAADHELAIAFVPYDNLPNAVVGEPLYGCRVPLFLCRRVGTIARTLNGEVTGAHPLRGGVLRGVMLQLDLEDPNAVRIAVLHMGRKPLFW